MMAMIGFAQGSETFENLEDAVGDGNGISNSYQGWTWTGDNGEEWSATDARTDQTINGKAILVRDGEVSTTIPDGIGNLTLTTERRYSGGEGDLTIFINGSVVGTIPYGDTEQTNTISEINIAGDAALLIETPGNGDRVAMDDLTWTAFGDTDFCAPPTNVEAGQVTFNQAEDQAFVPITWTPGGDETSWEVGFVNTNDPIDTGAIVVSGTPETTLELQVGTGYDIDVRATCDDGSLSDWVSTATVFTTAPIGDLCGFENFDNAALTASYSDGSFVGNNGVTWTYVQSRDENGDENNSGINGNAIMLRRSSDGSKITSSAVSGGISDFSVKLYKGFTGGGDREVELFVNGVSQGISDPFDDYDEHVFTVNGIDIAGDVEIEIRNITSKQVIVDDIMWTCFDECSLTDATGGIYLYSDSDTVCMEDAEIVEIGADSDMGEQNAWIISDENGDIIALPQEDEFYTIEVDFTGYDEGVYDVTFVTWDGEIQGVEEGGNLNDIDGDCYFMPDSISITVEQCVEPCEAPEVVEASNITYNSADISWSGGSEQGYWIIAYGEAPYAPAEDDGDLVSIMEYSLTDLEPGTEYDVYVRAMCQESIDNLSDWTGTTFTTNLPPCDYPEYSLTVVNADGEPIDCVEEGGSFYVQIELTEGSEDHTFDIYSYYYDDPIAENVSSGDTILAGPYESDQEPGFQGMGNSCAGGFETESIGVDICEEPCDAPTDITIVDVTDTTVTVTWTPGGDEDSWAPAYGYAGWDPIEEEPIAFDLNVTDTQYTFQDLEPNTDYDFYIYSECYAEEDMSELVGPVPFTTEEEPEDCAEPTAISFGQIDFTSAQVSWTPGDASQDKWEVVYGPAPFNPLTDTGESVTVEDNPEVTLTGLTPGTTYQIYVRAICDDGDTTGDYYPNPNDPDVPPAEVETPEYYIDLVASTGAVQDINNPTGNDGYTDYTGDEDKVVVIYENQPVNVTISLQSSGEAVNFGGWIDLNHDGVFNSAPMGVDNTPASGYEQVVTIGGLIDEEVGLLIPGDGLVGGNEYRVRIQVKKSALSPNDTDFLDGETEDYLVRVLEEVCEAPYNEDAATSDVYISSIDISGIGADLGDPTYDLNYTSNSMSTDGYDIITDPVLTVYPGLEGTYTVSSGPAGNTNQYYYSVWIDFNQNGCFEENEQVIWSDNEIWGGGIPNGEPGVEDVPITWEIAGIAPGTYQARIRNSMMAHPMADGNGDGEALDFTVEVMTEAEANMVLGVDSQVFTDFSYYPNPVENQLNLRAGKLIEQVEVFNLLGQKVIQEQPNALESNLTTDRLQSGVYLMNVTIDGSQKTFRIVKK